MRLSYLDMKMQACPVCGSKNFTRLKNNDRYFMGITTVGCNLCGLIQTNPRPTQTSLDFFYENDYRKFYQGVKSPNNKYIEQYRKKIRLDASSNFLANYIPFGSSNSSLLDIGCSEGAFFSSLREAGFLGCLYGVEINQEFGKYASLHNNAFVVSSLDDLTVSVDLITLNHVFEHILYPAVFLEQIKGRLKSNGYLYIDVPDAEEYSRLDDLHIAHIYHFTTRTLTNLLSTSGYEVIHCEKYSPVMHPKSIRVIARVASGLKQQQYMHFESMAWKKVRDISISMKIIRLALGIIPGVRYIYKKLSLLLKSKTNRLP